MSHFTIRANAQSVTGHHRANNEDRVYSDPTLGLFLVADGMRGLAGGAQASQLAIDHLADLIDVEATATLGTRDEVCDVIREGLLKTNQVILDQRDSLLQLAKMGTTIVLLLVREDSSYVAGLGDSRAYLIRGERLRRLTTDHTFAQAFLQAGKISSKEVPKHPLRRTLWKYLGSEDVRSSSDIEVSIIESTPGDRFLLASDGLTGVIPEAQTLGLVKNAPSPQEAVELLVQEALRNDSHDNVSCVAVYLD